MPLPARWNWGRLGLGLAVALLILATIAWWIQRPPDPKILEEARNALHQQHPTEALRLANSYLRRAPHSVAARLCAAQAEENLDQPELALKFLQDIPESDTSPEAMEAVLLAGKLYLAKGFAREAERSYRRVLRHRPQDVVANRQMMFLLTIEGRRWESRPYLLELVSQRVNTLEELILLGDLWPDYEMKAELDRFRLSRPQDPLPLLGLARINLHRQETASARDMLEQVIKSYPDLTEAHAWLGWTLVQDPANTGRLAAWEAALPPAANDHPMIWLVRGLGAEQAGQREAAARCFAAALERDPNYEIAAYQLARELSVLGREEEAEILRRRTEALYELAALLKRVHVVRNQLSMLPNGVALLREVAESMEKLGRLREAWAWFQLIAEICSTCRCRRPWQSIGFAAPHKQRPAQ